MKKKLWIAIPIALLVILFAWRIFGGTSKKKEMGRGGPQAVAVETAKVEIMDLDDSAMFSGNLKAAGSFILSPKVAGQLAQLYVDIGDTVSRGQVVGQLEDSLFRLEFDKAKANLEQAASSLAEAQKELDHSRQLLAKHFISQDEFDRINAKYVTEQAKHRAALAAKNAAEIQLSHTRIKADWSGGPSTRVIGERFAEPGQLLSAGAPLVSVLDISSLKVEIDVIESDYTRLKVGQTATLNSDSWPGEEFSARVSRIAPMLQESSRQARIELNVENPGQKLKPGMYARAKIVFQTKSGVRAIPSAALSKHRGEEGVFLVDKAASTVAFVPVEKGLVTASHVEILSPDLQGEVVSLGQDQLQDGSQISLDQNEKGPGKKPGSKPSGKPGGKK